MRKPENILQHELIGLRCTLGANTKGCQGCRGMKGQIIDETQNTVVLETKKGRKRIGKKNMVFMLKLGGREVAVDGDAVFGRPEDRIKKKTRKW